MESEMSSDLTWRGITLIADPDRDGREYWRQDNINSEWSVSREGSSFEAAFNVNWCDNGDWESICCSSGATAYEALDASLEELRRRLPEIEASRSRARDAAIDEFRERLGEIDNQYPVAEIQRALACADLEKRL